MTSSIAISCGSVFAGADGADAHASNKAHIAAIRIELHPSAATIANVGKKPSLKSSLGDALLRAGVVSGDAAAAAADAKTQDATRAAREELERARDSGDPRGIARYFI